MSELLKPAAVRHPGHEETLNRPNVEAPDPTACPAGTIVMTGRFGETLMIGRADAR